MKFKAQMKRKDIYNRYGKGNVIIIQSADIANAFIPDGYFAGVYGWNCDIYLGRNFAYTYGYRPFGVHSEMDLQSLYNTMVDDGVTLK